ncbi:MAG TPA: hypothetical protein PLK63_16255, partial [Catalimonadaceae bacterium]|nr:hypothetical protein [Catalimonadaceae bacterium]
PVLCTERSEPLDSRKCRPTKRNPPASSNLIFLTFSGDRDHKCRCTIALLSLPDQLRMKTFSIRVKGKNNRDPSSIHMLVFGRHPALQTFYAY